MADVNQVVELRSTADLCLLQRAAVDGRVGAENVYKRQAIRPGRAGQRPLRPLHSRCRGHRLCAAQTCVGIAVKGFRRANQTARRRFF